MEMTATQIARELDISRSYLYYLKNNHAFTVEVDENGRPVWNREVLEAIRRVLAERKVPAKEKKEESYRTIRINNRRYLGNKYKLLDFIRRVVQEHCPGISTVADIFAGTGAVASAFTDKKLITNDIMYSNYICHKAWFDSQPYSEEKLVDLILDYNSLRVDEENYMTENFADTYFSREDCARIGYIRENIENLYKKGEINERERALLITSLLYAMDKIAKTCGHYDAYRKGAVFDRHLELALPVPEGTLNANNVCYNEDTNELMKKIEADLVYIDPPYNSRQYCDAYHLLENVARWEKPQVHGVARKMDRSALKSDYCTTRAADAFEDLIRNTKARFILLSYNNMAEKGDERSNAKMSDEDIMRILGQKGRVSVYSESYKAFTTGKSDIKENEERLFLCVCEEEREVIPSPLNYTGGKFKLLPQILPLFPRDAGQVVDLFCGGCNVGLNVGASRVLFNDTNGHLIRLFEVFGRMDKEAAFGEISRIIDRFGLSRSWEKGYAHYRCGSSSDGLGDYNRKPFLELRRAFNERKVRDDLYYLMLYVLIVYSFNNQIRFNRKGEFNLPVGKRDFNPRMQKKLSAFMDRLKSGDYRFTSRDFREIRPEEFPADTFFYVDPPYLITCATYNEQNGWTEQDERDLLAYLDRVDGCGMRFALSNVVESRGRRNDILADWVERHPGHYRMIPLDFSYSNSNYHIKDKGSATREVLVVNYS